MNNRIERLVKIGVMALILALVGISISQEAFDQASSNNVLEVIVNNTNLAPNVPGHAPGTGERVGDNTTYWANSSAIELFALAHADTASQALQMHLFVNGTEIESSHLRPLAAAENTHVYVTAIIPKGSNYSINVTNFHHYEWREWPILAGKNGTLSINQTFNNFTNITGSSVNNSTIQINESQVNNLTTDLNLKLNKSGDTMTGSIYQSRGGHLGGGLSAFDFDSLNNYFFFMTVNRILDDSNTTSLNLINGSHPERYGNVFAFDGSLTNARFAWNYLLPNVTGTSNQQNGMIVDITGMHIVKGKLTLDNTTGKGIEMHSPNGNTWCTTVNNLGALVTVAGTCP